MIIGDRNRQIFIFLAVIIAKYLYFWRLILFYDQKKFAAENQGLTIYRQDDTVIRSQAGG